MIVGGGGEGSRGLILAERGVLESASICAPKHTDVVASPQHRNAAYVIHITFQYHKDIFDPRSASPAQLHDPGRRAVVP